MPKGIISRYDEGSGNGLIDQENNSVIRFHRSALVHPSSGTGVGDHVTYDIRRDEVGPVTANITISASFQPVTKIHKALKGPLSGAMGTVRRLPHEIEPGTVEENDGSISAHVRRKP